MIKDLSSKVSQLERVLNNATECIANINAMYEEKELAHTQKKRESKEAALKAPSPLTLLFEEQVKKDSKSFWGWGVHRNWTLLKIQREASQGGDKEGTCWAPKGEGTRICPSSSSRAQDRSSDLGGDA